MLTLLLIYLIFGSIFAVAFVLIGYRRVDESAADAGWLVRLLWAPGAIALWPLLTLRWKQSAAHSSNNNEEG